MGVEIYSHHGKPLCKSLASVFGKGAILALTPEAPKGANHQRYMYRLSLTGKIQYTLSLSLHPELLVRSLILIREAAVLGWSLSLFTADVQPFPVIVSFSRRYII